MKGFIELTLILILALFSQQIAELSRNIRKQINNFSHYKTEDTANSDLNFYISEQEIKDYNPKYQREEERENFKNLSLKIIEIKDSLKKFIIESKTNRIFNWKYFSENAEFNKLCQFNYLEIDVPTFFDCESLIIDYLRIKSVIANTGEIQLNKVDLIEPEAQIVAYKTLKIKEIIAEKYSSLLLFSQTDLAKLKQETNCKSINLQISDLNTSNTCNQMTLDSKLWPIFKIIGSKSP